MTSGRGGAMKVNGLLICMELEYLIYVADRVLMNN